MCGAVSFLLFIINGLQPRSYVDSRLNNALLLYFLIIRIYYVCLQAFSPRTVKVLPTTATIIQVVYVNKGQKGGSLAPLDPP